MAVSALAVCLLSTCNVGQGASPAPIGKIRTLFVDANNPSSWPKGLEPVSAKELGRLLGLRNVAEAANGSAAIERAVYRATFRDGRLCDGRASLVIGYRGSVPALVPLGDTNLVLEDLRWVDEARDTKRAADKTGHVALCGCDLEGHRVLIAEPGKTRLDCQWSAAGRPILDATEFSLVLPTAPVSQLLLRIPNDLVVECSDGLLSKPEPAALKTSGGNTSDEGRTTAWQIELGGHSSCRLTVGRRPAATRKSDVVVDQETFYRVEAEKTQIQSRLQFDVYSSPISGFSMTVPARLRVETVSYSDDVPLTFQVHPDKDHQRIDVGLPEPLAGKGRTVIVEGSTFTRTNQLWGLPRIDVSGAVRRQGEVQLTVAAPLKLLRFGGDGARAQIDPPSYSSDVEETFVMRAPPSDRPITIEVGEPAPSLAARVLELLDVRRDRCGIAADVICSSNGGSTFTIECEVPDAWDVTSIEATSEPSRVVHWSSAPAPRHKKRVTIDFFRAVTERESKRFRIDFARPLPKTSQAILLPLIEFPGFAAVEAQTLVTQAAGIDVGLDPPGEFTLLDSTAITGSLSDSQLLPHGPNAPTTYMRHRTRPDARAAVVVPAAAERSSAAAASAVESNAAPNDERGQEKTAGRSSGSQFTLGGTAAIDVAYSALDLRSTIDSGGTGDDSHEGRFSVAPLRISRPFRFVLEPRARLTFVAVNGRRVHVQRRESLVIVPSLPAEQWNTVEVHYKTSSVAHFFRETRPVVVPRAEGKSIHFQWTFAMAPGLTPASEPAGLRLHEALPTLSWTQRAFGPLGRPAGQSLLSAFEPTGWLAELGLGGSEPASDPFAGIDTAAPPPTWTVWHASADDVPQSVNLAMWREAPMDTLAWIAGFGFLALGLAWARARLPYRRAMEFACVAMPLSIALLMPGLLALVLGGCVSGTLLACVLSRSRSSRVSPAPITRKEGRHVGSTVSFNHPVALLFVLGWFGASAVFSGQEASVSKAKPATSPGATIAPQSAAEAATPALLVVIPVTAGADLRPSIPSSADEDRLVYVPREALAKLRRGSALASPPGNFVFLSSDYVLDIDGRVPPEIEATYHVALTAANASSVVLPISRVTLAGPDACRVDGRPQPLRQANDGLIVSLAVPQTRPTAADAAANLAGARTREPVTASRPQSTSQGAAAEAVVRPAHPTSPRVVEISLRFFPESSGSEKGAEYGFGAPKTRVTLIHRHQGAAGLLTVEGESGKEQTLAPGATIDLAETSEVRIVPGKLDVSDQPTLEARAVQFIRISPSLIETECRVTYSGIQDENAELEWLVPADSTVRSSGDDYRIARGAALADAHWVPLKIAVPSKPEGPLTVAVTMIRHKDADTSAISIPLVDLNGRAAHSPAIRVVSNQIGVTAGPGYRTVVTTAERNIWHTAAEDPAFRQEWQGAGHKEPDFIFDARGVSLLPVELVPNVPTHKVRMTHEVTFSIDRLAWKTTAEIRTENAPAFVHVLFVDPRLKIDSISIKEDDVNRLVRYSRRGDEVTLFLRDRAAATQDLVLLGSMPIELGQEIRLPSVGLAGATDTDARLLLEPDSQVDIAVAGRKSAAPLAGQPGEPIEKQGASRSHEYRLSQGTTVRVRVTRRAQNPGSAADAAPPNRGIRPLFTDASRSRLGERRNARPMVRTYTRMTLAADQEALGWSFFLLERVAKAEFAVAVPKEYRLESAFLDGRPIEPSRSSDGSIVVAIQPDRGTHRVALHWSSPRRSTLWPVRKLTEEIPLPLDPDGASVLLSLSAPARFRLLPTPALHALTPTAFASECRGIFKPKGAAASNQTTVEWAEIDRSDSRADRTSEGQLLLPSPAPTIVTWIYPDWLADVPAAFAGLIAAVLFLGWLPQTRLGAWAASQGPLMLAVCGVAWWLCLWGRMIGGALFIAGLAWLLVRRRAGRQMRSSESIHRASSAVSSAAG